MNMEGRIDLGRYCSENVLYIILTINFENVSCWNLQYLPAILTVFLNFNKT